MVRNFIGNKSTEQTVKKKNSVQQQSVNVSQQQVKKQSLIEIAREEDPFLGNDGRDAFLVMSSAYYDRTCLWSAEISTSVWQECFLFL